MTDTTRKAVKRYDPWRSADGVPHMKERACGHYVMWVDYSDLLARVEAAEARADIDQSAYEELLRAMPNDPLLPPDPPDPNDEYIERIRELEAEVAALREGIRVAVNRLEEPWTPVHAGCSTTIRARSNKEDT